MYCTHKIMQGLSQHSRQTSDEKEIVILVTLSEIGKIKFGLGNANTGTVEWSVVQCLFWLKGNEFYHSVLND